RPAAHRDPPSSPTRRSSDLAARVTEPPRPPLGSHYRDHRLASRRASQSLRGRRSARTTGITDSPRGARRRASAAAARLALPSTGYLAEGLERALDVLGVDVLVGDAADRGRADRVDPHLPRGALRHELA